MFINALWRNCWVGYWQGIQQWNSDYWKWFYLPTILLLRLGIYKEIFKQAERVTSNMNLLGNIFCLFFTFFANEMIYLKQEQPIFVLVLQYNCWAIQILTVKSWSLWHLSQPLIVYHLSNFKSWEAPPQTKAREKPLGQLSHTWPKREREKNDLTSFHWMPMSIGKSTVKRDCQLTRVEFANNFRPQRNVWQWILL